MNWGLNQTSLAKAEFEKALSINPKHLDVFLRQSDIAFNEADINRLEKLKVSIEALDSYASEDLGTKISTLKLKQSN